jgi:hypothetical protein
VHGIHISIQVFVRYPCEQTPFLFDNSSVFKELEESHYVIIKGLLKITQKGEKSVGVSSFLSCLPTAIIC